MHHLRDLDLLPGSYYRGSRYYWGWHVQLHCVAASTVAAVQVGKGAGSDPLVLVCVSVGHDTYRTFYRRSSARHR